MATSVIIRDLLRATPFKPFTVYVTDHRALRVHHPDFATLTQGGGVLSVNTEGDRFEWINTNLITRVESSMEPESIAQSS